MEPPALSTIVPIVSNLDTLCTPPRHSTKRSLSIKHPSPDCVKLAKRSSDEYNVSARKRLSNSTRTGQACDRCKSRKIKCDSAPGGCAPCLQNNSPCRTTDRITGRATVRGHTDRLEIENQALRMRLAERERRLQDLGENVNSADLLSNPTMSYPMDIDAIPSPTKLTLDNPDNRSTEFSLTRRYAPKMNGVINGPVPTDFQDQRIGSRVRFGKFPVLEPNNDDYANIFVDNFVQSMGQSTVADARLSILGMNIDLSKFVKDDTTEDSPQSFTTFFNIATGRTPRPTPLPMPENERKALIYVDWFFRFIHAYFPVVHKPELVHLFTRIYRDPGFSPKPWEAVIIHMVLAMLKFQYAIRNSSSDALQQSYGHYEYSVSFFYELIQSQTLRDLQALSLLCLYLRNFLKPGLVWLVTNSVVCVAMGLGLHRSAKTWPKSDAVGHNSLYVEMCKRVWWSLHSLLVNVGGHLGQPLMIREDDIDCELPEPMEDALPSEAGLPEYRRCSYRVALVGHRFALLYARMYTTVYSLKPPDNLDSIILSIEEEIRVARAHVPDDLGQIERAVEEDRIFGLYISFWECELRLMVRHPARCLSDNQTEISASYAMCLGAANEMLDLLSQMVIYKCLDAPWINVSVILSAIITVLFIQNHFKAQFTPTQFSKLKSDMNRWLKIIEEVGQMLALTSQLKTFVHGIIMNGLRIIAEPMLKQMEYTREALEMIDMVIAPANVGGNDNQSSSIVVNNSIELPCTSPGERISVEFNDRAANINSTTGLTESFKGNFTIGESNGTTTLTKTTNNIPKFSIEALPKTTVRGDGIVKGKINKRANSSDNELCEKAKSELLHLESSYTEMMLNSAAQDLIESPKRRDKILFTTALKDCVLDFSDSGLVGLPTSYHSMSDSQYSTPDSSPCSIIEAHTNAQLATVVAAAPPSTAVSAIPSKECNTGAKSNEMFSGTCESGARESEPPGGAISLHQSGERFNGKVNNVLPQFRQVGSSTGSRILGASLPFKNAPETLFKVGCDEWVEWLHKVVPKNAAGMCCHLSPVYAMINRDSGPKITPPAELPVITSDLFLSPSSGAVSSPIEMSGGNDSTTSLLVTSTSSVETVTSIRTAAAVIDTEAKVEEAQKRILVQAEADATTTRMLEEFERSELAVFNGERRNVARRATNVGSHVNNCQRDDNPIETGQHITSFEVDQHTRTDSMLGHFMAMNCDGSRSDMNVPELTTAASAAVDVNRYSNCSGLQRSLTAVTGTVPDIHHSMHVDAHHHAMALAVQASEAAVNFKAANVLTTNDLMVPDNIPMPVIDRIWPLTVFDSEEGILNDARFKF